MCQCTLCSSSGEAAVQVLEAEDIGEPLVPRCHADDGSLRGPSLRPSNGGNEQLFVLGIKSNPVADLLNL